MTGAIQDARLILDECRRHVRTRCLAEIERLLGGSSSKSSGPVEKLHDLPFVSACWTATGDGLLPDTPFVLAAVSGDVDLRELDDRSLCFALGISPEELMPALRREFDRRFAAGGLSALSCLDLVAAYVGYPLDVGEGDSPWQLDSL